MEETKLETDAIARAPRVRPPSVILAQLYAVNAVPFLLPRSCECSIKIQTSNDLVPWSLMMSGAWPMSPSTRSFDADVQKGRHLRHLEDPWCGSCRCWVLARGRRPRCRTAASQDRPGEGEGKQQLAAENPRICVITHLQHSPAVFALSAFFSAVLWSRMPNYIELRILWGSSHCANRNKGPQPHIISYLW